MDMTSVSSASSCCSSFVSLFFFSSRRRHTRYIGDWSSDVCSSDLFAEGGTQAVLQLSLEVGRVARRRAGGDGDVGAADRVQETTEDEGPGVGIVENGRSEERRVGKECRSGRSPDHEKKKRRTSTRS